MTDRNIVDLAHRVLGADKAGRDLNNAAAWDAIDLVLKNAPALARAVIELTDKLESGEASDGYHTHNELYEYRMLYHAHAVRHWLACGYPVTKSWNHADGEPCFGGGWFIVTAQLPDGQVSNHYAAKDWTLFEVPEVERPTEWDGHTPQDAAARIRTALNGETNE